MKTLIYLFFNTPTASELAFDLGSTYSFVIKKTSTAYVLHQNGLSDDLVTVTYNSNTADEVASLFIKTVEVIVGQRLNP